MDHMLSCRVELKKTTIKNMFVTMRGGYSFQNINGTKKMLK